MSNKSRQLAAMMTLMLGAGDNSFLSSTQGVPDEGKVVKPIPKVIPRDWITKLIIRKWETLKQYVMRGTT